jgi:hypothetical protein
MNPGRKGHGVGKEITGRHVSDCDNRSRRASSVSRQPLTLTEQRERPKAFGFCISAERSDALDAHSDIYVLKRFDNETLKQMLSPSQVFVNVNTKLYGQERRLCLRRSGAGAERLVFDFDARPVGIPRKHVRQNRVVFREGGHLCARGAGSMRT